MKVIYTKNIPKHPNPNVCYRSSFLGVIGGVTSVEVDDDFPDSDLVDQAYAFLDSQPKSQTVSLNVGITPELQASLDEAKAECEKVVAENTELKEQLDKERQAVVKLMDENVELKDKVLIAEKTLVAADGEIKALKATPKQPTAAELKALKAAEAEKPKE